MVDVWQSFQFYSKKKIKKRALLRLVSASPAFIWCWLKTGRDIERELETVNDFAPNLQTRKKRIRCLVGSALITISSMPLGR